MIVDPKNKRKYGLKENKSNLHNVLQTIRGLVVEGLGLIHSWMRRLYFRHLDSQSHYTNTLL